MGRLARYTQRDGRPFHAAIRDLCWVHGNEQDRPLHPGWKWAAEEWVRHDRLFWGSNGEVTKTVPHSPNSSLCWKSFAADGIWTWHVFWGSILHMFEKVLTTEQEKNRILIHCSDETEYDKISLSVATVHTVLPDRVCARSWKKPSSCQQRMLYPYYYSTVRVEGLTRLLDVN